MRIPAPHLAARTAAATETAALSTGTGARRQASSAGSPSSVAQVLAAEHGDEPRKLRFEAIDRIGLADAGRLEVQRQGARGHAEPDPTAMASLEPRDLLGNERGGPERKQEGCGRGPARRVLCQDEGGHLQRLRHVSGEAAVVLARHDAVESGAQGEAGLCAELADECVGGKVVVRVQPDRDRSPLSNGVEGTTAVRRPSPDAPLSLVTTMRS